MKLETLTTRTDKTPPQGEMLFGLDGAFEGVSRPKDWGIGHRKRCHFSSRWLSTLALSCAVLLALGGSGWADHNWRILHARHFGVWDSICDANISQTPSKMRCYLRNVFRLEPHLNQERGAVIIFVVVGETPPTVQVVAPIGGSVIGWRKAGIDEDAVTHALPCGDGRACDLEVVSSSTILDAMGELDTLDFCFAIGGNRECRPLPLSGFRKAFEDVNLAFMLGEKESNRKGPRVFPSQGISQN